MHSPDKDEWLQFFNKLPPISDHGGKVGLNARTRSLPLRVLLHVTPGLDPRADTSSNAQVARET
eukprot:2550118-Rhodomonas_salina.1